MKKKRCLSACSAQMVEYYNLCKLGSVQGSRIVKTEYNFFGTLFVEMQELDEVYIFYDNLKYNKHSMFKCALCAEKRDCTKSPLRMVCRGW